MKFNIFKQLLHLDKEKSEKYFFFFFSFFILFIYRFSSTAYVTIVNASYCRNCARIIESIACITSTQLEIDKTENCFLTFFACSISAIKKSNSFNWIFEHALCCFFWRCLPLWRGSYVTPFCSLVMFVHISYISSRHLQCNEMMNLWFVIVFARTRFTYLFIDSELTISWSRTRRSFQFHIEMAWNAVIIIACMQFYVLAHACLDKMANYTLRNLKRTQKNERKERKIINFLFSLFVFVASHQPKNWCHAIKYDYTLICCFHLVSFAEIPLRCCREITKRVKVQP